MMNIANILKELRTEAHLTQTELSSRLNIGQATIACYENGQREPHLSILLAYADFFECSIDYLVGRTDDIGNIVINKNRSNEQSATLKNDEVELLKKYNKLNTSKRLKAQGYLEGLSEN